jgi:hypothetical protein
MAGHQTFFQSIFCFKYFNPKSVGRGRIPYIVMEVNKEKIIEAVHRRHGNCCVMVNRIQSFY